MTALLKASHRSHLLRGDFAKAMKKLAGEKAGYRASGRRRKVHQFLDLEAEEDCDVVFGEDFDLVGGTPGFEALQNEEIEEETTKKRGPKKLRDPFTIHEFEKRQGFIGSTYFEILKVSIYCCDDDKCLYLIFYSVVCYCLLAGVHRGWRGSTRQLMEQEGS
jgi:hypothetical protein